MLSIKCYNIRGFNTQGLNSLEGNTDFYNRKKYCNANVKYYTHSEDILPYFLFSMKEDNEIKTGKHKQNSAK